jgi:hypothetical protein
MTVLIAQYSDKRGLERWPESWGCQNKNFLPTRQLQVDLQLETLIPGDLSQTYEELRAWLYWDKKKNEEAEQEVEPELLAAGGFRQLRDGGMQGGIRRITASISAEKAQYQFS